jgi:hypothetical protein
MFPDDRVLVGVINRKRDMTFALHQRWYRIPQARMRNGVNAEYIAFFLSHAFKERNGAIHYYGEVKGLELVYRKDLIPDEANHPRALEAYYKVQLGELVEKSPPIINPTRRSISFIYTTWDRFVHARQISDLYSRDDYFVDRIYHALRNAGVYSERTWSAEYKGTGARLRILCQKGTLVASTVPGDDSIYLDDLHHYDDILAKIYKAIAEHDGPHLISIPPDNVL